MIMHQDFLVKTGYAPIYMKNIFAFFKKGRELILGPKKKDFLFKKEESHVCIQMTTGRFTILIHYALTIFKFKPPISRLILIVEP